MGIESSAFPLINKICILFSDLIDFTPVDGNRPAGDVWVPCRYVMKAMTLGKSL